MEFIAHRVNTVDELKNIPTECGVEVDLRDYSDKLVLQHEPFKSGEDFKEYLKHYHHGTMILNIKSERIEHRVLELINKYKIIDYFLLDSSFPMIYSLSKEGERNIAVRYSEYEGLDTVLMLKGKVEWVWVDCFTELPIDYKNYRILKEAGFKLCLVSPELQNRVCDIEKYKDYLDKEKIEFDAVCSKIKNINKYKGWIKN